MATWRVIADTILRDQRDAAIQQTIPISTIYARMIQDHKREMDSSAMLRYQIRQENLARTFYEVRN